MERDDGRLDVQAAAERQGCSRNTIYRMVKKGALPSELVLVVGRAGRRVRKYMIRVEDLDAAFYAEDPALHIARIVASAPRLSEDQKARISTVLSTVRKPPG